MGILVGAGFLGILIAFFIYLLIMAVFLWIGAAVANVKVGTFGRSLWCAFLITVISLVVSLILSWLAISGTWLGLIISSIITLFVIKGAYRTSFGRAFLVWVFSVIAFVVITLVMMFIVGPIFVVA